MAGHAKRRPEPGFGDATADEAVMSTQTKATSGFYAVPVDPKAPPGTCNASSRKVTHVTQSKTTAQTLRIVFSRCRVAREKPRVTG
jgi:hypothetical protein